MYFKNIKSGNVVSVTDNSTIAQMKKSANYAAVAAPGVPGPAKSKPVGKSEKSVSEKNG